MNREPHAVRRRPSVLSVAAGSGGDHQPAERPPQERVPPTPAGGSPALRHGFEQGRRMVEVRANAIAAVRGSLRSW